MQQIADVQLSHEHVTFVETRIKLENQRNSAASWFFLIACLSVVNSIIMFVSSDWSFIIGLGITQVIDGISAGIASAVEANAAIVFRAIAVVLDAAFVGLFVVFGLLAKKGYRWSFIIGMLVYLLDSIIFVLAQDFISIGFHIFVLWGLYKGLSASNMLNKLRLGQDVQANYASTEAG